MFASLAIGARLAILAGMTNTLTHLAALCGWLSLALYLTQVTR